MKSNEFVAILFRTCDLFSEFCISSNETPEINERYPGTIGRTHGEMNESKPKMKAVKIPTFSTLNPYSSPHQIQQQEYAKIPNSAGRINLPFKTTARNATRAELFPHNPDLDLAGNIRMEFKIHRVNAESFNRLIKLNDPLVDDESLFLERVGDHL
jgi:hypothetical protein